MSSGSATAGRSCHETSRAPAAGTTVATAGQVSSDDVEAAVELSLVGLREGGGAGASAPRTQALAIKVAPLLERSGNGPRSREPGAIAPHRLHARRDQAAHAE